MTLAGQLAARRYVPWLYWAVILATSTAGTTMSDYMDRTLGLGYATGSALILFGLLVGLVIYTTLRPQPALLVSAEQPGHEPA